MADKTDKLDMGKEDLKAFGLSEEIEDLPEMLRQLFDYAKNFHETIFQRQSDAIRFKNGDQWGYNRPPGYSMITLNKVGPQCDIIASNITEPEWIWQVSPCHAGVDNMVKIFNGLLEKAAMQDSITTHNWGLMEQALSKGYGMVKLSHDPDRQIPTHYEVLTPTEYMGEPGVRRPDIDGALHIHTAIKTAKQVRDIWPDKWDEVEYASMQNLEDPTKYEVIDERGGEKDNTYVIEVKEFWIKDDRMEPIPAKITDGEIKSEHAMFNSGRPSYPMLQENHQKHIDEHNSYLLDVRAELEKQLEQAKAELEEMEATGGQQEVGPEGQQQQEQPPTIDELFDNDPRVILARTHIKRHENLSPQNPDAERSKYNGWRHIIALGPDCYVVHNGATPYKDNLGRGKVHFYALPCIDSATDYFGLSVVEKAMEPQEILNLSYSKIFDHLTHVANGIILDVTRLAIPPNQIRAAPGGILPVRGRPSEIAAPMTRESIDPIVLHMLSIAEEQISLTTGVSEIHMGGYPSMERASQPMISSVAHLAEARWRAYHRQYADFLKKAGSGMLEIIQQFMTEQAQVRIARGMTDEYEIVNRAVRSPDGNVTFVNDLSIGRFDVDMQLKPMSALTDDAKTEMAIKLFTLGTPQGYTVLDEAGFAEMVEDPVIRESVIRQIEARKQAAQKAEALQKAYLKGEIEIDGKMVPFTAEQYAVLTGGKAPNTRSSGGRMRPNPKAKAGYGKR